MKIAVLCVGNRLMLDDGVGPAVHDVLQGRTLPESVDLFDVGCMTMDMVNVVRDYDWIITVDAVDGTDEEPGTLFRYTPDEIEPRAFGMSSLHELRLSDLFEAAFLLGHKAEGVCYGIQVENPSPAYLQEGLTPSVAAKVDELADCVVREIDFILQTKGTNR